MQFIYDNNIIEVGHEDNILLKKWKKPYITGDVQPSKPGLCIFNNSVEALKLLNKHIINKSRIGFHTDVDVDGIGSTYIGNKFINSQNIRAAAVIINKDKVHGIQQKHADFFNSNNIVDLMIITDSSTNEIDIIKQFNCDVLVVDHHECLHDDLLGKCNDGIHEYVIVNNTLANSNFLRDLEWLRARNSESFKEVEEYLGESRMSCGLVVYELLRLYLECFGNPRILENLNLFQWVGVTLLTDAINLLNERNQWYMDKTVHSTEVESSLKVMMNNVNRFKATLDKTYINYSFAPIINKAIRAGKSSEALNIVLNFPEKIMALDVYKKLQEDAINKVLYTNYEQVKQMKESIMMQGFDEEYATNKLRALGYVIDYIPRKFEGEFIAEDISSRSIHPNYSGVIAGRLAGENDKNTAVFIIDEDGMAKGSFRGRLSDADYRSFFENYADNIYAQGHPPAFGFRCKIEQLNDIMSKIGSIETETDTREFLSCGIMPESERGVYHIQSFDEFKRAGYLLRLGIGNSTVDSKDIINIKVPARDVLLKEVKGKLYIYNVYGLECKAFKQLSGEYFNLYIEFTNELNMYIK